jgi:hypothetical protein
MTIGAKTYLVPPLNIAAFKKHKAFLDRVMQGGVDPASAGQDDLDSIFDLIFLALKRNYKELDEAALAEDIDLGNLQPLFAAVMKTAGFEDAAPGEK